MGNSCLHLVQNLATSPVLSKNVNIKSQRTIKLHVILNLFDTFIHSFLYFPFINLQVQPKDVEIVIMYLLNYRCQMTEYNYNTMIT